MRTHQRIGLLAGCVALGMLYMPQCLGIATGWPTRPRLAPAYGVGAGLPVELQAAALSEPGDQVDGARQDRAELQIPEVEAWMEGQ